MSRLLYPQEVVPSTQGVCGWLGTGFGCDALEKILVSNVVYSIMLS